MWQIRRIVGGAASVAPRRASSRAKVEDRGKSLELESAGAGRRDQTSGPQVCGIDLCAFVLESAIGRVLRCAAGKWSGRVSVSRGEKEKNKKKKIDFFVVQATNARIASCAKGCAGKRRAPTGVFVWSVRICAVLSATSCYVLPFEQG